MQNFVVLIFSEFLFFLFPKQVVQRKFKNGFRHGTTAKPRSKKGKAKAESRAKA